MLNAPAFVSSAMLYHHFPRDQNCPSGCLWRGKRVHNSCSLFYCGLSFPQRSASRGSWYLRTYRAVSQETNCLEEWQKGLPISFAVTLPCKQLSQAIRLRISPFWSVNIRLNPIQSLVFFLAEVLFTMPTKGRPRSRNRRNIFSKAKVKGFLRRARRTLQITPCGAQPQKEESDSEGNLDIAVPGLFEGALTMVDTARLAQSTSPGIPHRSTKSVRYVIQSRTNDTIPVGRSSEALAIHARRQSRRLTDLSAVSLSQPCGLMAPSRLRPDGGEPTWRSLARDDSLGENRAAPSTPLPTALDPRSISDELLASTAKDSTSQHESLNLRQYTIARGTGRTEAQFFRSPPLENTSSEHLPSPITSSRHLTSGASSRDTFIHQKFARPVTQSHAFKASGAVSDPFLPSDIPFSSDAGQHELRDIGYRLSSPPELHHRIPDARRRLLDDTSSARGYATPMAQVHQDAVPQQGPLHSVQVMDLNQVIDRTEQALDTLTERMDALHVESRNHFWNAGVFARRLSHREGQLAAAQRVIAAKDEQIAWLYEELSSTWAHGQDEHEASDLYNANDDRGNPRDGEQSSDKQPSELESESEDEQEDEAEEEEEDEEDGVLLSSATENRRFWLELRETASDSALLDIRPAPDAAHPVHPYSS